MAEPPRQPQEQGAHQLPKEESSPPSEPPPAYIPPAGGILLTRLSQLFNHNPEMRVATVSRPEPPAPPPEPSQSALAHLASLARGATASPRVPAAGPNPPLTAPIREHEPDPWDDDHSECEDLKSPVTIRINAGIRISSNSNIVTVTASPGDMCAMIAKSVVAGMREASGGVGIPMIDEDGHPRPLRIEVDAGLDVNGIGNIVGREDVVLEIMRIKAEAAARRAAATTTTTGEGQTPAPSRVPSGFAIPGAGFTPGPSRVASGARVPGDATSGPSNVGGNAYYTVAPAPDFVPSGSTAPNTGPTPAPAPEVTTAATSTTTTARRLVSIGNECEGVGRGRDWSRSTNSRDGGAGGTEAGGERSCGRRRARSL